MTEPTIAEQAEALAASLQSDLDRVPAYSPLRERATLSARAGISLARMVAALARQQMEQRPNDAAAVSILLEHQGPFFNGVESQCGCGEWVLSAQGWAEHVGRALEAGAL